MGTAIVTNNPYVREALGVHCRVVFHEGSGRDVLEAVRDEVHAGAILLTHPQYANVQLSRNPVRSVAIQPSKGPVDKSSLEMVEAALASFDRANLVESTRMSTHKDDYCTIDLDLFTCALESMGLAVKTKVS